MQAQPRRSIKRLMARVASVMIITVAALATPDKAEAGTCIAACCACIPTEMCDDLRTACINWCYPYISPASECRSGAENDCEPNLAFIECNGG